MEITVEIPKEKLCLKCKQTKPISLFYRDRGKSDRRDQYCKECKKAIGRIYAQIPAPPEKVCGKCKRILPIDSFSRSANQKYGRHSTCKDCRNIYRRQNIESVRKYHRNRKLKCIYGLSYPEYQTMLEKQDNSCAICGKQETASFRGTVKSLAVDHDHKTGKVRGLLCSRCNAGLGTFGDDTDLLRKAIQYLLSA